MANAQALIGANVHKAASKAKADARLGGYWIDVAAAHEVTIEQLCRDLNEYSGHGAKPARGCEFVWLPLGDAEVLVEAEIGDEDSPPAPINVLLNRVWCSVEDVVPVKVIETWEQCLIDLRAASVAANKRAA